MSTTFLKAKLTTDLRNVVTAKRKSEHEGGYPYETMVVSQIGEHVVVEAKAQDLMFLLGMLAGMGEDGLVSVEPLVYRSMRAGRKLA